MSSPTLVNWWRMFCGLCTHMESGFDTRDEAIGRGRDHIKAKHADAPEWEFRVQGIHRDPDKVKQNEAWRALLEPKRRYH